MLDVNKPVMTKSGLKARIICKDRMGANGVEIIALVQTADNYEKFFVYCADGTSTYATRDYDLVNVKHQGWVNIYPDGIADGIHKSKQEADQWAGPKRVACIFVEWEE